MNSGLLYKVALLIRDKADQVKDKFINSLLLPTVFRDDLAYILGYRWGLDAANQSGGAVRRLHRRHPPAPAQ